MSGSAFEPTTIWPVWRGPAKRRTERFAVELDACKPGELAPTRHKALVRVRTAYLAEGRENNPHVLVDWCFEDQDNLGVTMPTYSYYNLTGAGAAYNFILWALQLGNYSMVQVRSIQYLDLSGEAT